PYTTGQVLLQRHLRTNLRRAYMRMLRSFWCCNSEIKEVKSRRKDFQLFSNLAREYHELRTTGLKLPHSNECLREVVIIVLGITNSGPTVHSYLERSIREELGFLFEERRVSQNKVLSFKLLYSHFH